MKNKERLWGILLIVKYSFSVLITIYAYCVLKNEWYLVVSLVEFFAILLISYTLLAINQAIGHTVHFLLVLIYNLQTIVMRFGGTFTTLIMVTNISLFQDLKGKFSTYLVTAFFLMACTVIPAKRVVVSPRQRTRNLIVVFMIYVVSFSAFTGKYSPICNLFELLKDYEEYRNTAEMIGATSADASRFYRSELESYTEKPKELSENPNVILIFAEGLSKDLVSDGRNFMPNLKKLESESLSFERYYNHTFATLRGLIGQLYSGYQFENLDANSLISLQSIFKNRGYQTTFINTEPSNRDFSEYLSNFDFNEVVTCSDSIDMNGEDIYIHDRDAYELLYQTVTQQYKEGAPFFTAIYTFGTHVSLDSPDEKYGDGANALLNKFYNLDVQFGKFMEKFEDSDLSEDTVLVFTTDHATYQDEDYFNTFGSDDRVSVAVDEIPLYIYFKGCDAAKKDAAGRNSLDLAPTLLDYLDISAQNYFLGNSLFQETELSNKFDSIFYYPSLTLTTKSGNISEVCQDEYEVFTEDLKAYFAASGAEALEQMDDDYLSVNVADDCSTLNVVLNTKQSYENVWMPTWSQRNEQDDLVWYQAKQISEGEWTCTVDLKGHGDQGIYIVHVYEGGDSPERQIAATTAYVPDVPPDHLETKISENKETVTIALTNAKQYEEILFPVWSETDNQDDLVWYHAARNENGEWIADVPITDHCKVLPDKVIIHVYGRKVIDGELEFLTASFIEVE